MIFNLLEGTSGNNSPITLILFGVIIVGMIGLLVWQSIAGKKKQKEAQNMVNNLKKGDRVKTIGGICGFVCEINDSENTFVLETGTDDKKSYVKFDKGAIYQTAPAQGNAVAAPKAEENAAEATAQVEEKPTEKTEKAEKPTEKAEAKQQPKKKTASKSKKPSEKAAEKTEQTAAAEPEKAE